ncbi:MAG: hypothetical protein ACE15F_00545 [bacterium]
MGVLAVDFCQVPPQWADHEGRTGQAQDGWWGIPRNGGIAWDQDVDSKRDTESSGEKSFIAHPAQAVDSMPPASAGTALYPLFRRVFAARPGSGDEWLVLLLPAGASPASGASLRNSARRAGWPGPVFLTDGAVALALAHAWKKSRAAAVFTVLRDRILAVEGSLMTVHASGNTLAAELVCQCRREDKNETVRVIRETGWDPGTVMDGSCLDPSRGSLENVARMMNETRGGKVILEIKRMGVLGTRARQWDLCPLIGEDAPVTAAREYELQAGKDALAALEFWFGYNASALHPLAGIRLTRGRLDPAPAKARCRVVRRLNGDVQVTAEWNTGSESRDLSFPILWL